MYENIFMRKMLTFGALSISSYDRYKKMIRTKVLDNLMKNMFCLKHFFIKCAVRELQLRNQKCGYINSPFGGEATGGFWGIFRVWFCAQKFICQIFGNLNHLSALDYTITISYYSYPLKIKKKKNQSKNVQNCRQFTGEICLNIFF